MTAERATTTVVDAGARYGMHPSWRGFAGALRYFAFEPDEREAERLRTQVQQPGFEVVGFALAKATGERELYVTKHRGYSSFLRADLESEWFGRYRPGEGVVEGVVRVQTSSVDEFASVRRLHVDFMKVDTEGTELEVLEGASGQLEASVLGVRVNVNFQTCYLGQALFPETHTYLTARGFFLLNLDYFGRGVPRNSLFRNPDPLLPDSGRYGTLIGTDGVWLRRYEDVCARWRGDREGLGYASLKYVYFCMLNHAPDVGIDVLHRFVTEESGSFDERAQASQLYRGLRRVCAEFLGRWRAYPDAQWDVARGMFKAIFGLELPSGGQYWELLQSL